MSIASAIQLKQQQVAAAYTACDEKGATMPAAGSQNLSNLATTIGTISGGGLGDYDVRYLKYTPTTVTNPTTGDTETSVILEEKVLSLATGTTAMPTTLRGDAYLMEVELPDTMNTINQEAFLNCSRLAIIKGLEHIEYLGDKAFEYNSRLMQEIYMPALKGVSSSNTYLSNETFQGSGITAIRSLGSITMINGSGGNGFCANCTNLTEVHLPSTLTAIGGMAFHGCSNLTTVNWADLSLVTTIDQNAFRSCSKLVGVLNFPSLTGTLGNEAFRYTKITSITSLGSITEISGGNSSGCFADCTSLISVTLPNTLEKIGARTFGGCSNMTSINIPTSLTHVYAYAFQSCSKLTSIDASGAYGNKSEIYNDCFRYCSGLTTVKLPKDINLTNAGFAFAEQGGNSYNATTASNLDFSLDMSESETTTLPQTIFYRSKIQHIVSLGVVTTIADANSNRGAFTDCTYLIDAVLPSTLTYIGTRAFSGCSHLTTLTCYAETPPTVGSGALPGVLTNIYVPSGSVSNYQTASGWSSFASIISAIS